MELLDDKRMGEKMLTKLHQVLIAEYPKVSPAEAALASNLKEVNWWKGGSSDPLQDFIDLLRYLTADKAPDICYPLAHQAQLTDLGMMGYAMMTAGTIQDFILVAGYALDQFDFPVDISLTIDDDNHAAVIFTGDYSDANCFDAFIELDMALAWHYIEAITPAGIKLPASRVSFAFSGNDQSAKRAKYFYHCPIDYQAPRNAILFPAAALKERLSGGSLPSIVECSIQCSHILGNTHRSGKYSKKVEQALIEAPQICQFSFAETANYLDIPGRTLRAQLASEGSGFRKIAMHIRMQVAQEYLKTTTLPIKHIAYMLAYTEPNNFVRAFTAYTGQSPGKYRVD